MKYTKNNGTIEYYIFLVSYIIVISLFYSLKKLLAPYIDEFIYILIFPVSSLLINYFTLFNLLSKYFFKLPYLKKSVVNFNGEWKVKGESSYNTGKSFGGTIKIKQTLTDISVNAFFKKSKSKAISCHVLKENDKEQLIYNYFNYPQNRAGKLDKHHGTVVLEKLGDNELQGDYFTDRKPQTKGTFKLKKVK